MGRQDSTAGIPVGVAEKQFVVHLLTFCQKVLRRAMAPALGVRGLLHTVGWGRPGTLRACGTGMGLALPQGG